MTQMSSGVLEITAYPKKGRTGIVEGPLVSKQEETGSEGSLQAHHADNWLLQPKSS